MHQFWVVGRDAADAAGGIIAGGVERDVLGPYTDYAEAEAAWAERCATAAGERERHATPYRIARIDPDEPPPCTD